MKETFVKKTLILCGVFFSIILPVLALTPIHELGHALACVLFGGTVEEISILPGDGYAGYTILNMPNPTALSDYIVSAAGYVITLLIGVFLLILAKSKKSVYSFAIYLSSLIFIFTATGQLLYTIIAFTIQDVKDEGAIDIVGTLTNYPDSGVWIILVTILLFSLASIILIYTFVLGKQKLKEFIGWLSN